MQKSKRNSEIILSAKAYFPTIYGSFELYCFRAGPYSHLALVKGEVHGKEQVLVRIHSECLTGDVFGSKRCDCGKQLERALAAIGKAKAGILIYLKGHEGRGIGLEEKIKAYALQDEGLDTVDANLALGHRVDVREYREGVGILNYFKISSVVLMSNNPAKSEQLEAAGIVVKRVPLIACCSENRGYLKTKKEKLGHLFEDLL